MTLGSVFGVASSMSSDRSGGAFAGSVIVCMSAISRPRSVRIMTVSWCARYVGSKSAGLCRIHLYALPGEAGIRRAMPGMAYTIYPDVTDPRSERQALFLEKHPDQPTIDRVAKRQTLFLEKHPDRPTTDRWPDKTNSFASRTPSPIDD